ncbi:hypothetical protein [Coleofasciculus sp. FACHB-1120]|nr:hypothetical protein [Coleofasciculus sp. FACHB-1120]MBD2741153.1 hypothetical protein [Coleofasciculus sp. FACHB-1120]
MNKKIVSLLLVLGLATTLAACQEGTGDGGTTTSPSPAATSPSPSPTTSP